MDVLTVPLLIEFASWLDVGWRSRGKNYDSCWCLTFLKVVCVCENRGLMYFSDWDGSVRYVQLRCFPIPLSPQLGICTAPCSGARPILARPNCKGRYPTTQQQENNMSHLLKQVPYIPTAGKMALRWSFWFVILEFDTHSHVNSWILSERRFFCVFCFILISIDFIVESKISLEKVSGNLKVKLIKARNLPKMDVRGARRWLHQISVVYERYIVCDNTGVLKMFGKTFFNYCSLLWQHLKSVRACGRVIQKSKLKNVWNAPVPFGASNTSK